jgi:RecA-family ATPase
MRIELEREILAGLAINLELLDLDDQLSDRLFSSENRTKIFRAISKQRENDRRKFIDEGQLQEQTGLPFVVISQEIQAGYRMTPEHFQRLVFRLHKQKSIDKIIRDLDGELKSHLKTGEWNEAEVRKILQGFAELEALDEDAGATHPLSVQLSTIAPEAVAWLWPNYLPANKLVLVSGDPGCGKTWFCLDLAARYSTGREWPDRSPGVEPGGVLIFSCEDGAADTFRPRLDILGANSEKIFLVQEPVDLSDDVGRQKFAKEVNRRQPGLIIVDPIFDFSGGVNPNATEKVRAMITPVAAIAEKARAELIFTSHLNKASTMQALYRTSGSASGWIGKARAAFLIFEDDEDKEYPRNARRIFFPVKNNLSPLKPEGLAFRITNSGLVFERLPDDFNLEERLAADRHEIAPELEEAKTLIRDALQSGPVEAKHIQEHARREGVSERTLNRAKKSLKVKSEKSGFSGKWMWSLP